MLSEKEFKILLTQYKQCFDCVRGDASQIWQIPSLTMAINSFLAIAYLGYAETSIERILILLAALAFTWVSTVQLEKHQYFQQARISEFKWIQEKLIAEFPNMLRIKLATDEIWKDKIMYAEVDRKAIRRQKAFAWLTLVQHASTVAIFVFFVIELLSNFYFITIIPK